MGPSIMGIVDNNTMGGEYLIYVVVERVIDMGHCLGTSSSRNVEWTCEMGKKR
jgi:hypothetical protein